MGCDIHLNYQRKTEMGWEDVSFPAVEIDNYDTWWPLGYRSYGLFGFLVGVRNYSHVPPLSNLRGLPDDFAHDDETDIGDHSFSWLSLEELTFFDYDQSFEDRRTMRDGNGAADAGAGNGEQTTFREFLGPGYFTDLQRMIDAGVDRIVFGFDS